MACSRIVSRRSFIRVLQTLAIAFSLVAVLLPGLAAAQEPVPELPRVYIDTTWNPPTGKTWHVTSSPNLQLVLNVAQPGDTIILSNGSTYSGNFTLPAKANPNNLWIYIESSGLANLPPAGSRVSPSDAPNMAKIVTPNVSPAITINPGANHYRLVGLEITTTSNQGCDLQNNPPVNCFSWFLIDPPTSVGGQLADSITIDRSYIHGSPTQDTRQGVTANGTNFAIIDSYISDIHQSTSDSQAILAYWTPGPIKIVNNYLSATTEDVMFGGAGDYYNPYVPSDIEIRNNHFYKPLSWDQVGITVPPNNIWVEKDNLELKSAQRVLISGNTLENTWVSGQLGFSVDLTVRTSQSGNLAVVDDITFENNLLTNVDAGWSMISYDELCNAQDGYPNCTNPGEAKRWKIYDNLLLMSTANDGSHHWAFSVGPNQTDAVIQHNTVLMQDQSTCGEAFYFNSLQSWGWPPPQSYTHNLWILDNALCRQPTGDNGGQGTDGMTYYMGDPAPLATRYWGNVMFVPSGDRVQSWPAHNYATTVPFVYQNPANGDYILQSPYWTDTTDGKESGIDWPSLLEASTTVLLSGQSSLYPTQSTTLTATVSVSGSSGAPTGTVTFMLGNTQLGTGTLTAIDGADASASMLLQGSVLSLGPNSITAVYSGDSNYLGSTSPAITVTLLSSDDGFGPVNVGTPAPVQTLTYTFSNNAQLTAINILTMGAPNLDFQDGGSSTCHVGIPYMAGQSCNVMVEFTPAAPGSRSGAVTLFAQGSNLPLMTWYLSGMGESPAVTIDPGTQTTLGTITNATTYGSAVDGAGNVYVADKANGQVVKFAAGTDVQTVTVSHLSAPTSVTLDGAGNLYVAESSGVVMVPNENGTLNAADLQTVQIAGLGLAQGIAEDGNGNLYVADSGTGTVIEVPGGSGTPETIATGLTNPHGVAVDAAGNVYVSSDNQVSEYPVGGGTPIPMGSGYLRPQAAAVDASGTVYVADTGHAQIVKVAPGGESQSVISVTGLTGPHGVTVDAAGDLYVSDSSNVYEVNRVQAAQLNFGNVPVGNTSPAQTLQVSNVGNQQLTVSSLAITANYQQQPSGGSDCSGSSQLSAGTACAIAAAFSPTTTGVLNGTVTLTDNALNNASSQQTVSMTGTGVSQQQQQTITFPNPGTQTYGVPPITLTATASSGLPVSYTVISGPATVSGNALTITGAGSVTVQANQAGNSQWLPAPPVNDTFTVNPAVLTVTANNATITEGSQLPTFTASYSGFVNGDGQGVLSGSPSLTTTAPQNPPVGTYPIIAARGTLSAQNYTFTFVNGTLTVTPAVAQITSPPKNSTLTGSSATFTWTHETGATSYQLWLGHSAGAHDIASIGTSGLSVTATNLPTDGSQI
ncbi:MAG: MBG domain-containing protein, partial [Candidatus Korobacteraceae bacterium]